MTITQRQEVSVICSVWCSKHNKELITHIEERTIPVVFIDPCPQCLAEAHIKGHNECYEEMNEEKASVE